jgi:hypothetical protein
MSFTVPGGRADFKRFAFVCYGKDIPDVLRNSLKTEQALRRHGFVKEAKQLGSDFEQLGRGLEGLGAQLAVLGSATLREVERATRVRPEARRPGHKSLNDALFTRPLAIPGGIGIADFVVLDRDVEWWPTNEFGSSARVGGRLFGTFYGATGAGPPDASQFREHPLFQPGPNGSLAGVGIIENPIPARHFIEKSITVIDKAWRTRYKALVGDFNKQLDVLLDEVLRQKKAQRAVGRTVGRTPLP